MPPRKKEQRLFNLSDIVGNSHTMDLCLRADYKASMTPDEAFRELAQNWRDGIVKFLDIDTQHVDFMTCIEKTEQGSLQSGLKVILFRAFMPGQFPRKYGGFIRFEFKQGRGTLEFVNFHVEFQPWHLTMGGTSKRGDQRSVGTHGEGVNLAILTLVRDSTNMDVTIRSGGFHWTFDFGDNSTLRATAQRLPDGSWPDLDAADDDASTKRLMANHKTDMSVMVGLPISRNNEFGNFIMRNGVTEAEFIRWQNTTLFLQAIQPEFHVRTTAGSLLLNHFKPGKLYLKGFLLASPDWKIASHTGKGLWYSYDLFEGKTNRDRQFLSNAEDEAKCITNIWDLAIQQRPDLVENLHLMLMDDESDECADIHGAPKSCTERMAMALKKHLLKDRQDGWLLPNTDVDDAQTLLAITGFDMEALPVPKRYFQTLKRAGLVRTVADENKRRALSAPIVHATSLQRTSFAQTVYRNTKHVVTRCPWTAAAVFEIMKAGKLQVPMWSGRMRGGQFRYRMHEKWFSWKRAAEEIALKGLLNTEREATYTVTKALIETILDRLPESAVTVYRDGLLEGKKVYNLRSEKLLWAKHIFVASCAEPVTVEAVTEDEASQPSKSAVRVAWVLPPEWIQDDVRPEDTSIQVQLHSETNCSGLRWYGPKLYTSDSDGYIGCGGGPECQVFSGNGTTDETVFRVDGSPEEFYAIVINSTQPDCMPLFSMGDDVDSSDDEDDLKKDVKDEYEEENENRNENGNENGSQNGNERTDSSDDEMEAQPRPGKRQRLFSDQE